MHDHQNFRVCILTTAHAPDDERIFHKQALSLAQAGYTVALVGCWTDQMDSGPIKKVTLPGFTSRWQRLLQGPFLAFLAARRERAGVYHFHDPELLLTGVLLKLCRARVIYDVHEDYSLKIQARHLPWFIKPLAPHLMRAVEWLGARFFDHLITADSHVASLFPPHKTTVIANYPPLHFVTRDEQLPAATNERFRIVYVGGISLTRGIGQIIAAVDCLADPQLEFHLAGDVKDRELLARIREHPQIIYHGQLPWQNVRQVLAQCHVGMLLFQPTAALPHHPGENIIKLWEYLGFGLPVIISDTKKLRALIEQLAVGIAVDPTDPQAIAAAIRTLRDNDTLRQRLAQNGVRAVRQTRNWEQEAVRLIQVYRQFAAPLQGPPAPTAQGA